MAIYRQVQTVFWQDGFVGELTPEERYIYLYFLTNPRVTQCGIFEINMSIAEAETGYNRETLEKLIERFEEYGKIMYSRETREIIILNWMKYNFINSRNTISCINKELKLIKNKAFVKLLYKSCLKRGYDIGVIFKGVSLTWKEEEDKTEGSKSKGQTPSSDSIKEETTEDDGNGDTKNKPLTGGLQGACKPLGEEEEKKEKQKEEEKTEEVEEDQGEEDFSCKLLMEFNKNIRQATIRDLEKLGEWRADFGEEIVIQAIYEAVKRKGRHTNYIGAILENWKSANVTTMEELQEYMGEGPKKDQRCNSDAYEYLD